MIVIPLYYIDYIDYNLQSVSVTIIHEVGSAYWPVTISVTMMAVLPPRLILMDRGDGN